VESEPLIKVTRGEMQLRAFSQDSVENAIDGCRCVDQHCVAWQIFSGRVQAPDQALLSRPTSPLGFRSSGEPSVEDVQVDLKDEDPVEDIDEAFEVSRTATEEGLGNALIGSQGPYLARVPYVVLVGVTRQRLAGCRIALVGELCVAIDGVISALAKRVANRRLA
jgi:hypothetical protein